MRSDLRDIYNRHVDLSGDFGDVRGMFTLDWWYPNWNQYGLFKLLVANHNGSCGLASGPLMSASATARHRDEYFKILQDLAFS